MPRTRRAVRDRPLHADADVRGSSRRSRCRMIGACDERLERADSTTVPATEPPTAAPPRARSLERRLAGYRLLRRIANGDRADVYLADASTPVPGVRPATMRTPPALVAVVLVSTLPSVPGEIDRHRDRGDDRRYLGRAARALRRRDARRRSLLPRGRAPAGPALSPASSTERTLEPRRGGDHPRAHRGRRRRAGAQSGFVHTRLSASDVILDATGRPRVIGLGALRRLAGRRHGAARPVAQRA